MKKVQLTFKGFYDGMKSFGSAINTVIIYILLLIVYLLGVGPVAIIGRILGKKFINLQMKKANSYWEPSTIGKRKNEDYRRPF